MIPLGDVTTKRLVQAIVASPAWHGGRNAIVVVWNESDYSGINTTPNGLFPPQNQNKVVLTAQTNYSKSGVHSSNYHNSFSLLKGRDWRRPLGLAMSLFIVHAESK